MSPMYTAAARIQALALSLLLGQLLILRNAPMRRFTKPSIQGRIHEASPVFARRPTLRLRIGMQPANHSISRFNENIRAKQISRNRFPPRIVTLRRQTSVSSFSETMPERLNHKVGDVAPQMIREVKSFHLENFTDEKIEIAVLPPKIAANCTVQVHAKPTCNDAHHIDLYHSLLLESLRRIHFGGTRNVWRIIEDRSVEGKKSNFTASFALKTLRFIKRFSEQTYDRQQKEAVVLNYLSKTPGVVGMFGFCGTTLLSEYANRDTLSAFLKKMGSRTYPIQSIQLLQISWRLARAVANVQGRGTPNIGKRYDNSTALQVLHRDIDASNILMTRNHDNGRWDVRLDDFNHAYVLKQSSNVGPCTFQERFVCGEDGRRTDARAPEECRGDEELTNKVDTHGLGTVLFYLLTHRRVYNLDTDAPGPANEHLSWYRERVKAGATPQLPRSIESDNDAAIQTIVKAMRMCMETDPAKRPSAQDVASYLLKALRAYVLQYQKLR